MLEVNISNFLFKEPRETCKIVTRESCNDVPNRDCQPKARDVCSLVPKIITKEVIDLQCKRRETTVCKPTFEEVTMIKTTVLV